MSPSDKLQSTVCEAQPADMDNFIMPSLLCRLLKRRWIILYISMSNRQLRDGEGGQTTFSQNSTMRAGVCNVQPSGVIMTILMFLLYK